MSKPTPARRTGRPPKTVTDQVRADALMEAMRRAEKVLRETNEERVRLAREAYDTGLTMNAIAEALGVSHVAVSNWIRAAKQDASSHER